MLGFSLGFPVDVDNSILDADEDGLSDQEEIMRFLNPLSNDSDGDGLRDHRGILFFALQWQQEY